MRDAPSIAIVQALLDGGADVYVFDPEGMEAAKAVLGPVTYNKSPLRDRSQCRGNRRRHRMGRVPRPRFPPPEAGDEGL
jgi:hypothetical protein